MIEPTYCEHGRPLTWTCQHCRREAARHRVSVSTVTEEQSEILALRAKLQAAEALNEEYRIQLLMADKISGDQRSRAEAAEGALVAEQEHVEILEAEVGNLASLVRILVHSLRKVNPNSSNIIRAMDYLTRHRLTGSILRSDEPQPKEIPESGGHVESPDCWGSPTVEEHPGGRLVIHNQTH